MQSADLVGLAEIAQMAGVSSQAVANWRARSSDFPQPLAELRSGPVFSSLQVRKWVRNRKSSRTSVVAIITPRSGVEKTTTTIAIAEMLAVEHQKRVLLIDLDRQVGVTIRLIGMDNWAALNEQRRTLAHLLEHALSPAVERSSDITRVLQKNASPVDEVETLDLLPSSIELGRVQDKLSEAQLRHYGYGSSTGILHAGVQDIVDEYDFVLIYCPADMGIIALNGLRIADGYIILTTPNAVSIAGIERINQTVAGLAVDVSESFQPYGVVVSELRPQSRTHYNVLARLRRRTPPRPFKTVIPAGEIPGGFAHHAGHRTLRDKYQHGHRYDLYRRLTSEIVEEAI